MLATPSPSAATSEKQRAGQAGGGAAAGTLTDFGFDAASYGSKTTGNPAAESGPTALSHVPCTRYVPRSQDNVMAAVGDGDGIALEAVTTHNHTAQSAGATEAVSRVHIAAGTLAGGQVEFSDLTGRVRSFHNASGYHVQTVSQLGALTVGGVPVVPPGNGGEEMEVPVPGLGTLVLNHTIRQESAFGSTGGVNVLRFNGNDGTTERVGRAYSRIDGQIEGGVFAGAAWGSDARVDGTATLGRAALRPMPCLGTRGKVLRNSTGAATFDFGNIGVRRSAVSGVQTDGSASGFARSTVAAAGFGDGQLRFRNITAVANVTRRANGTVVRDAHGTGIGAIILNGEQILTPPAGEPQQVLGIGTFTVRSVQRSPNGIDVTAVSVRLHNGTPANTADDTVVNLGRAKLAIRRG